MLTLVLRYKLAARDLDSILPIYRNRNPHGSIGDVRLYNVCDVKDLAIRLGPILGPNELTERDGGPEIDGIEAAKRYKVSNSSLTFFHYTRRADDVQVGTLSATTYQSHQEVPHISKAGRPGYKRTYNAHRC